ncbi:MAG: site-specific integrase [Parasporobacterium sp.]|nr:site-specific integrase [Parasporobacterium sp.]
MNSELQAIVDSGIISSESLEELLYMAKKAEILKRYHIWQGKNGRFFAHIYCNNVRKLVSKSTEKDLIQYLADADNYGVCTLLDLCKKFFERKINEWSDNTRLRNEQYFKKYLANEPLLKENIKKITYVKLEEFLRNLVIKHEMTRKTYNNVIAPVRFAFEYATYEGVDLKKQDIFKQVKLPTKLFKQTRKPESSSQVYTEEEQRKLINTILENYSTSTPLAIVLAFYTGTRVGEMMALKWDDVHENYIHIQRMEQRNYDNDNHLKRTVVNHAKTDAGTRDIPLTSKAKDILRLISDFESVDGYIFCSEGKRTTSKGFECALRRYCRKAEIPYKSSHKIRKTYISTLIDNNININTIREIVGHEDAQTTYNSYCYDRKDINTVRSELENIL